MLFFSTPISRSVTYLALTALAFSFAPLAVHAQATRITSAAGLAPGDTTLTYKIGNDPFVSSYTGSAGGNTLTFTDAGRSFYEAQQGQSPDDYHGAFPDGTNVLATLALGADSDNNPIAVPAGPLTITFASGVTEFGLSAQNLFFGDEAFAFVPYSGTNALGVFTVGPLSNPDPGNTGLAFLGAKVGSGSITSVQISSFSAAAGQSDDFAFGPVTFATAAPEPSAWVVLGAGALTLAGLRVRRRRA